ncbi:MAG: hypothetical protein M1355_02650 [Patescibacteria group bacterium]|nr:hypothetical protein [Patescibacteria group bacterium]
MLRKISLIPFLILFTLLLLAILLAWGLKFTVLNPNFIKNELKSQDVYNKVYTNLPLIAEQMMPKEGERENPEEPLPTEGLFTSQSTITFAQNIISKSDLERKIESAIDSLIPWFLGSDQKLALDISLKDIKINLIKELMKNPKIKESAEAMPVCADLAYFISLKGNITCRPPEFDLNNLDSPQNEVVLAEVSKMIKNIPDTLNAQTLNETSNFSAGWQKAQDIRSKVVLGVRLFYLGTAVLILLIFTVAWLWAGNLNKTPLVFGIFLAIYSSLYLIIINIGWIIGFPQILRLYDQKINQPPFVKNELILPLIKDVLGKIRYTLNLELALVILFSTVLISISLIVKKRSVKIETST